MRPKEIKKLIDLVESSNISELEVSRWGRKVRIRKDMGGQAMPDGHENIYVAPAPAPAKSKRAPEVAEPVTSEKKTEKNENIIEIESPMVGTFYRAPAPDAKPYVEVGQVISKGQVLCIIEAMKLMNEIEAETSGRIVEIHAKNAQPVEFNQVLFTIEKV